jgi:hypothetical protein
MTSRIMVDSDDDDSEIEGVGCGQTLINIRRERLTSVVV